MNAIINPFLDWLDNHWYSTHHGPAGSTARINRISRCRRLHRFRRIRDVPDTPQSENGFLSNAPADLAFYPVPRKIPVYETTSAGFGIKPIPPGWSVFSTELAAHPLVHSSVMFAFASLLAIASVAVPRVLAHGGVLSYSNAGNWYQGW